MTVLLSTQSLGIDHGGYPLFDDLTFGICEGDHIGLVGPNGAGKSSLLRVLAGLDSPTSGAVVRMRGLRVGYVPQESVAPSCSVREALLSHLRELDPEEERLRAEKALSFCGFSQFGQLASSLSGGWRKRLDLATALAQEPHLILLDEPTNHLDLESIEWLETLLARAPFAYIVSSHDRSFLERVSRRTMELNRCFPQGLFVVEGAYQAFCQLREQFLNGQIETERSLSSKARRELEWLRRTAPARTSKSAARTSQAHALLKDLADVKARNRDRRSSIGFEATERETRKLLACHNLSKSLGGRQLFKGIDLTISPGTRLALMGPNGCGKTTLLKILAAEASSDIGTRKPADDLKVVVFDQHRQKLPLHLTLKEALSPQGDFVEYQGQQIHVNGWAQRFLFDPGRLSLPLSSLSGGERARILIARLMQEPADLLMLDEPTNDLDIPTLETLETALKEFPGGLVLISHDRSLIDGVATQVLAIDGQGQHDFFADRSQAQTFLRNAQRSKPAIARAEPTEAPKPISSGARKPSFAQQKASEEVRIKIDQCEHALQLCYSALESAEGPRLAELCARAAELERQRDLLYERWLALES